MTNAIIKAIALFEEDAAVSRSEYFAELQATGNLTLEKIMERDAKQERTVWAIELLHAEHVRQASAVVGQRRDGVIEKENSRGVLTST